MLRLSVIRGQLIPVNIFILVNQLWSFFLKICFRSMRFLREDAEGDLRGWVFQGLWGVVYQLVHKGNLQKRYYFRVYFISNLLMICYCCRKSGQEPIRITRLGNQSIHIQANLHIFSITCLFVSFVIIFLIEILAKTDSNVTKIEFKIKIKQTKIINVIIKTNRKS